MLEKLNGSPGRIESAADLYDWDELVQEDRVHRLIYTDPAIFEAEMTQHLRRGLGLSRPREPDPQATNDYITTQARPAADHPAARLQRQDPRAVQPLHPSRHHAVPQGQGLGAHVHLPVSRLELPQHRQAARGAVAGRLCLRLQGREVQRRAGAARRQLSRLHLRARSIPMRRRCSTISAPSPSRSTNGSTASPNGKIVVCEANRLKYKGNWKLAYDNSGDGYHVVFSHRSLLEMENRLGRRGQQGHVLLQGLARHRRRCTWPIWATAITSRTSGRTSRSAPAGCGRSKARARHRALPGGVAPPLRRQGRGHPRPRLLRAGQHQRVPELLAARQPHPGVRAGLGRRDQRHLVRHRGGRRGRRARRRGRRRSTRCACARRSSSRISARSTTSPISRRSSAGSPASRTSGSTCTAGSASPAA